MSGSGNHDSQRDRALGGKLKEEVLSALRLLFKNVEQHSVSLLLEPNLTIYPMPESRCQHRPYRYFEATEAAGSFCRFNY
jgi:hypothetical protein